MLAESGQERGVLEVPSAGRIPGNRGIWAGILAEMTEFALLFCVYFVARAHFPQPFHDGPQRLNLFAGTFNTLLMITGSYCVASALIAVREGRKMSGVRWLLLVLCCGCGYFIIKYFEFRWNAQHGVSGGSDVFITVYYYLSFTHMVHVGWGGMGLLWVVARTAAGGYTPQEHSGIEAFASYWHATDLVWLVIFPLFYLLR